MASLRATERALAAARGDEALGTAVLAGQPRHEVSHLKRTGHGFGPFVAGVHTRARARLLDVFQCENAEGDRHAGVAACLLQPAAHSPATYSKCGVSPRITQPRATIASLATTCGKPARDHRQLEGLPVYARDKEVALLATAPAPKRSRRPAAERRRRPH